MFVSSYNTYIHPNTTDKTSKTKGFNDAKVKPSNAFASKLSHTSQVSSTNLKNTPINYINNNKIFNNRQKLQQNIESNQELANVTKFNTVSSIKGAKVAYIANTTMFSLVAKPKATLANTTPSLTTTKKLLAINSYISNDRYYQITA